MRGLELSEKFYFEAIKQIVESLVGPSAYSAALIGWGSDVLGYDDEYSRDHNWGPRLLLFVMSSRSAARDLKYSWRV